MRVIRYTVFRLVWTLPTLLGSLVVVFMLTQAIPGNAALDRVGLSVNPETIAAVKQSMGLDQPLPVQFLTYLKNLATGNLGHSWKTGNPVAVDLVQRLPATIELGLTALLLAIVLGVCLGVLAAARRGGVVDRLVMAVGVLGLGVPVFWLSLMAIYVAFFRLGIAPAPTGRLDILDVPPTTVTGLYVVDAALAGDAAILASAARHLVLPTACLTFILVAPIARMTRSAMLDVLGSNYIRAARAAGLPDRHILFRAALRNAFIPVITLIGQTARFVIGGVVLVEVAFSWPGIGRYAVESMMVADLAPVQAVVLLTAIATMLINILVDVSYFWIDPRIEVRTT